MVWMLVRGLGETRLWTLVCIQPKMYLVLKENEYKRKDGNKEELETYIYIDLMGSEFYLDIRVLGLILGLAFS